MSVADAVLIIATIAMVSILLAGFTDKPLPPRGH